MNNSKNFSRKYCKLKAEMSSLKLFEVLKKRFQLKISLENILSWKLKWARWNFSECFRRLFNSYLSFKNTKLKVERSLKKLFELFQENFHSRFHLKIFFVESWNELAETFRSNSRLFLTNISVEKILCWKLKWARWNFSECFRRVFSSRFHL